MFQRKAVTRAQKQGPRDYQEDYLVHVPFSSARNGRGHLLGVMDGHAGGGVAKYCAETIPRLFDPSAPDMEQELRKVVDQLDARTMFQKSGSTISLACVNETQMQVTTGVLGDSPIIVADGEGRIFMSEEHNARSNMSERTKAISRGALYVEIEDEGEYLVLVKGGDGLQLTRALGDNPFRKILDRTLAVRQYQLDPESVVIVASDGLLDSAHGSSRIDMLQDIVRVAQKGNAADIVKLRKKSILNDNTSVILWKTRKCWSWF